MEKIDTFYIVRDAYGTLWMFFQTKPVWSEEYGVYQQERDGRNLPNPVVLNEKLFPNITSESGPVELQLDKLAKAMTAKNKPKTWRSALNSIEKRFEKTYTERNEQSKLSLKNMIETEFDKCGNIKTYTVEKSEKGLKVIIVDIKGFTNIINLNML